VSPEKEGERKEVRACSLSLCLWDTMCGCMKNDFLFCRYVSVVVVMRLRLHLFIASAAAAGESGEKAISHAALTTLIALLDGESRAVRVQTGKTFLLFFHLSKLRQILAHLSFFSSQNREGKAAGKVPSPPPCQNTLGSTSKETSLTPSERGKEGKSHSGRRDEGPPGLLFFGIPPAG